MTESADNDESLLIAAEKWEPDPADADSNMDASSQDIIAMLVGIYGSKELFIHEYRYVPERQQKEEASSVKIPSPAVLGRKPCQDLWGW